MRTAMYETEEDAREGVISNAGEQRHPILTLHAPAGKPSASDFEVARARLNDIGREMTERRAIDLA